MSETSLDIFFDNLVEVLIQDLAYYLPSKIIPSEIIDRSDKLELQGFFDEILVVDVKNGLLIYETEEFNKLLLKKHTSLEKHIFQLLKKKGELEVFEFDYILDKYFRQVEFYVSITYWLSKNLSLYNKGQVDNSVIGNFHIQYEYYQSHFNELIEHFYTSKELNLKESFNLLELAGKYFPDLIARYNAAGKKYQLKEEIIISKKSLNRAVEAKQEIDIIKELKQPKKEKIITEKIADEFILESVFNISVLNYN